MKIFRIIMVIAVVMPVIALSYGCSRHAEQPKAAAAAVRYHCPMHPSYISDKPGNCPICGMKLVPMENKTSSPAQAAIKLSPERRQLIGIKSEAAQWRTLAQRVRSPGRVAYDPDLYHAIVDYQQAAAAAQKNSGENWPELRDQSNELMQSAALKLKQLGLPPEQIAELAVSTASQTGLLVNQQTGPVWIYAEIYEYQIGLVKPGQPAGVQAYAYPGRTFEGTVRAVDTIIAPDTHTLKVRIEVRDPQRLLKPEMLADVTISASIGTALCVPRDAVLDTGNGKTVFIDKGDGSFEPRQVTTGYSSDKYAQILSGLRAGEKVVTSANFLLDSESQLKNL
jgi:Cu(I)/Ag(I) efflux system membrane fusion protein